MLALWAVVVPLIAEARVAIQYPLIAGAARH